MTKTPNRAAVVPLPRTLRHADELIAAGLAAPSRSEELEAVAARYAVAVTPEMAALIDPADASDAIALQFVPRGDELVVMPGETADPIADYPFTPVEGIVHRYPDRALFKITGTCAVYCRFCFRREMVGPGKAEALSAQQYAAALGYLRANPGIWEVILTGGDPLILSARRLAGVMRDLAAIPHIKVVRIHTRVPVVDPARIDRELVGALKAPGIAVWVALHANHPRELTDAARAACARLIDAGIPMVSQSVLLRGVNDDAETLTALMRAFVACRIKPYYLHHGDLAPGTAHLRVSLAEGQELMRALRGRVSGLCQPDYVLDIPGGHGKVPVGPAYLAADGDGATGRYRVTDYCGDVHLYPPE
ncbi:MAG: lysine-2,3-aminomutase-like protein [Xanthobacteraceae bacterium]|nr:MAG: lysine-2,3-aminomutase-like protein [Xanthobacteraceae bacterium]